MVLTSKHGYVKIKSSILGIRYWINEDGALIINGPNGARQKYSKIKKEAFSWKICQSMVPVFRRYKAKNGAKTQINGYASFLFVFQLSNNW